MDQVRYLELQLSNNEDDYSK